MKILSNKKIKQYRKKVDNIMKNWEESLKISKEAIKEYDNLLILYEENSKDNINYLDMISQLAKVNDELYTYAKRSNEIRSLAQIEDQDEIYFPKNAEEWKEWQKLKNNVETVREFCEAVLKDKLGIKGRISWDKNSYEKRKLAKSVWEKWASDQSEELEKTEKENEKEDEKDNKLEVNNDD